MTTIFPTDNDCVLDTENDPSTGSIGQGNTFFESRFRDIWFNAVPTSSGSWVMTDFTSSQSFPTGGLTLTVARGVAMVWGVMVDFSGQSSDIDLVLPDDTHVHVYLGLTFDGQVKISGYQWILDTTPVFRQNAIAVGQAIVSGGSIQKWMPFSYPEGWRMVTGSFDTNTTPQAKPVVLGFQPLRVQTGTNDTLETYGFSIDATGQTGTFEAILFEDASP